MNKKVALSLIILLSITSCVSSPAAPTLQPTSTITWKDVIWPTAISPTYTSTPISNDTPTAIPTPAIVEPTLPPVSVSSLQPGIYPVFSGSLMNGWFVENKFSGESQSFVKLSDTGGLFSPDGQSIIFMDNNTLWEYSFFTGEKRKIPQPDIGNSEDDWSGSWSPDGRYLVYAVRASYKASNGTVMVDTFPSIFISDLETNRFVQITNWIFTETMPIWSPDGNWIAFISDNNKQGAYFNVINATDVYLFSTSCLRQFETCQSVSSKRLTNTGLTGNVPIIAWSPDSTQIAYVYEYYTGENDVYLVNLEGQITRITNTQDSGVVALSWSPWGNALAFRILRDSGTQLQLFSISGKSLTGISDESDEDIGNPFWSPDGNFIAYTDNYSTYVSNTVKVYSIKQKKTFSFDTGDTNSYQFEAWLSVLPPFQVGAILKVSPLGDNLHLHEQPSLSSAVIHGLPAGQVITIIAGPVQADDYSWSEVKAGDLTGWVAQVPLWYLANNPLVIGGN